MNGQPAIKIVMMPHDLEIDWAPVSASAATLVLTARPLLQRDLGTRSRDTQRSCLIAIRDGQAVRGRI